jgi:hypothetical protein
MPRLKWTDDEIAKLRSLAGRVPAREIAAELGRTPGSLVVQASKLKIPLRCSRSGRVAPRDGTSYPSAPTNS